MEIKRNMLFSFVAVLFVFFLSGVRSAADPFSAACCLEDGSCRQTTETECIHLGGEFQGFGADCATFDCP
jgi:hypothetical protein